jgi:multidrug efflux system outer membrane protein
MNLPTKSLKRLVLFLDRRSAGFPACGFWPVSRWALFLALPFMALALLAGCAVGPDYKRPEATTIPAAYTGAINGWKIAQPQGQLPKGDWWEIFGDPELSALEVQATGANQELKAAVARFDEARAEMDVTRAGLFPNVAISGDATRSRVSANAPLTTTGSAIGHAATYNDFTLPLDFSYEVDLWGRVRRSVESARAQAQASADDLETVKLMIQAEVAVDYFTLRALDSERAVLRSSIEVFSKSYDLTRNRRAGGVATDLEVAQAETVLKTTQAQLPSVTLQRAQFEHALALLAGQPASTFRISEYLLSAEPPVIPPGLPSELLERRPDISAAERRMAAANASIGVARAAFFPAIQLNGLAGLDSVNAGSLFNWSSRMWAVGPTLTLPLFEGGRLRAGLRLANATYDEMVASYRQTVLTAFSEVEDNLASQGLLAGQYEAESGALLAARKQLEVANNRYRDGLITYLEVATAESTELNIEFSTVQLRGQQLVAAVALIKSLGGGWQDGKTNL